MLDTKGRNQFSFVEPWRSKGDVELTESECNMSVNLIDMPEQSLVIQAPKGQSIYFQSQYGRVCDYFVIVPRDDGADVVLCEMKKTLGNRDIKRACRQLKCSIPLFYYIKAALKTHFGDDGKTRMHYAVIALQRHPKLASIGSTSGRNANECYDFEKYRVNFIINHEAIPLRKLFACTKSPIETAPRKKRDG